MAELFEQDGPMLDTPDDSNPVHNAPEPAPAPDMGEGGDGFDEPAVVDDGEPGTPVSLDDPGDEGDRANAKSRKAERYDTMRSERDEAARRLAEAQAEAARLQGRLEAMESFRQQPAPQTPQEDPLESEIRSLREQRRQASLAFHARQNSDNKPTEQEWLEFQKRDDELDEKYIAAIHERVARQNRPDPNATHVAVAQAQLQADFPDIMGDPAAAAVANAEFQKLVLLDGMPRDIATARRANLAARQILASRRPNGGHHPAPPPSYMPPGAQYRTSGAPPGSNQGGNTGQGAPTHVVWTSNMAKMAQSMYPYEPNPAVRKKRYIEDVVKGQIEDERRGR